MLCWYKKWYFKHRLSDSNKPWQSWFCTSLDLKISKYELLVRKKWYYKPWMTYLNTPWQVGTWTTFFYRLSWFFTLWTIFWLIPLNPEETFNECRDWYDQYEMTKEMIKVEMWQKWPFPFLQKTQLRHIYQMLPS